MCFFQSWPFLFRPSLHAKLDYDGVDCCRTSGTYRRTGAAEGMMTCLGGYSGWQREPRGEANPGRQGWLPVTMLDLCWNESVQASKEPQIISLSLSLSLSLWLLTQTHNVWTQTLTRGKLIPLKKYGLVFYQPFSKSFSERFMFLFILSSFFPFVSHYSKRSHLKPILACVPCILLFCFFIHERLVRRAPEVCC